MGASLRSVEVDGARLVYAEHGDPAAEPVVLLHGYPANHLSWRHQIPSLAEHHRVLALDWLGWGESERRLDLAFDYDTEVARLGRALDALGIDDCNLFGHDYGGFLALGFAQRNASRVRRLAILNSRAHRSFVPAWYAIFSATSLLGRGPVAPIAARLLPLEAVNRLALRRLRKDGVVEPQVLDQYLGWISEPVGARWLVHFFGQYRVKARPELGAALGEITCPTAVVWGTEDRYLRTAIAEELAAGIPAADLTLIPDTGHFVMEEAPDLVTDALARLLRRPAGERGAFGDSQIVGGDHP